MKQMTNGMVTGRGFFPGKGGRRGFPMIGDEFAYFPHDKPFHDFGPYPNFPPPDAGFFPPGPMGFMGHPPGKIMFYFLNISIRYFSTDTKCKWYKFFQIPKKEGVISMVNFPSFF